MKKANKRKLYIFGIILASVLLGLLLLFVLFVIVDSTMPLGHRGPEENYQFHISEPKLIQKIHEFKKANPEFVVPNEIIDSTGFFGFDGKDEVYDTSYFIKEHHFLIYFKSKKYIFRFYTRDVVGESAVVFYGVDEPPFLDNGNWKSVNAALQGNENKEVKNEFEKEFLDKLGVEYDKEGDSLPILTKYKDTPIIPLTISGIIVLTLTIVILAKTLKKNR